MSRLQDLMCLPDHVSPQRPVVITEPEVDNGDGNAISVPLVRVNRDAVFRPRLSFSPASKVDEARLQCPDFLFEAFAESLQKARLTREHEARVVQLVLISADVVRLAEDVIESRNIGVVGRAIII